MIVHHASFTGAHHFYDTPQVNDRRSYLEIFDPITAKLFRIGDGRASVLDATGGIAHEWNFEKKD